MMRKHGLCFHAIAAVAQLKLKHGGSLLHGASHGAAHDWHMPALGALLLLARCCSSGSAKRYAMESSRSSAGAVLVVHLRTTMSWSISILCSS